MTVDDFDEDTGEGMTREERYLHAEVQALKAKIAEREAADELVLTFAAGLAGSAEWRAHGTIARAFVSDLTTRWDKHKKTLKKT